MKNDDDDDDDDEEINFNGARKNFSDKKLSIIVVDNFQTILNKFTVTLPA